MYTKTDRSFHDIPQLSSRDVSYQTGDSRLSPFFVYPPELASFEACIETRRKFPCDRDLLTQQILHQYEGIPTHDEVHQNIEALLSPSTFTVITAHQPVLLTGPLYVIYKIASAISLSRRLNATLKESQVIPVFILGGEDHDFDEVASCHLFNKTFTWETNQKGAVGRMAISDLKSTLEEVLERFGTSPHAAELEQLIRQAYDQASNYGQFIFRLINALFGSYGLVTVSMDNAAFKEAFVPYMLKDLKHMTSHKMVQKDQHELDKSGFKPQALAREVNLFYHGADRDRILREDSDSFEIGGETIDREGLTRLIREEAVNISPNVVLRPLYQEIIFPNLAYIGGGGELAYWMERKSMFEAFEVPFPMLIRRDSFLIVDQRSMKTLNELDLELAELFEREEQVINRYALNQANTEINLSDSKTALQHIFEDIGQLSRKIDPTLYKSVMGECSKAEKIIEYLEGKLLKAEKRNRSVELNKISKLKNKFFPNNDGLQERYENFIPYYLRYGQDWIDAVINHADPLNKSFKILIEETGQAK